MEEKDALNSLIAGLHQQLEHLQNTDNSQFAALDKLLQQAAGEGSNANGKEAAELLQLLSKKIDDAETLPVKEKIINKTIKHLQGYKGNDMAGKMEYLIRSVISEMDAEEKEQQTKTEKERNERINNVVEKSIADALKRNGF
jgi:hypothetical protein